MMQLFYMLMLVVLSQRIAELLIAKRNATVIQQKGGYEVGATHYKYIVMLHMLFFLSMLVEAKITGIHPPLWWQGIVILFILTQLLRFWCIRSLGTFWNTRIFIIPGAAPITKGPYRWLRHPNYVIVTTEMVLFPLIFGLNTTAIIFPILNIWVLRTIRIPVEEKAWTKNGNIKQNHS